MCIGALLVLPLWPTVVKHVARGSLLAVASMLAISKADLPTYSANYTRCEFAWIQAHH